jgi:hypothetical protein
MKGSSSEEKWAARTLMCGHVQTFRGLTLTPRVGQSAICLKCKSPQAIVDITDDPVAVVAGVPGAPSDSTPPESNGSWLKFKWRKASVA